MSPAATRAREAIGRGDLISAYDETVSAIEAGDSSPEIRHQQVLALARMGDTERAMALFEQYGLDQSDDAHQQSIGARLMKDRALAMQAGAHKDSALKAAASAYYMIFAASGDSYPGINAASLAMLSGQEDRARRIAAEILDDPAVASPDNYYNEATRAEALLILGRIEHCVQSLRAAAGMIGNDHGAKSTTCRQIKLLARHMGLCRDAVRDLVEPIQPARVAHFCGHIFAADSQVEATISAEIECRLQESNIGFAFGALAAGGDILVAEAVLARGGELHVVLPFAIEDFVAQSVRPAGDEWVTRFERCMAEAESCTLATEMVYVGDPHQFSYCTSVAMGRAKLRAQHLGNQPIQLAIWDGVETEGPAGTGPDVAAWREQGGETIVINPAGMDSAYQRAPAPSLEVHDRALAAIIFTDFPGFSKLAEEVLPRFWNGVMRTIAEVLNAHPGDVLFRNRCALCRDLQRGGGGADHSGASGQIEGFRLQNIGAGFRRNARWRAFWTSLPGIRSYHRAVEFLWHRSIPRRPD